MVSTQFNVPVLAKCQDYSTTGAYPLPLIRKKNALGVYMASHFLSLPS
jgi:hypothetical protein